MKHIVVGTAGHIDHGKSTLVEALTGIDPDRLKEEKARGITIDLGFARYRHGDTEFAFVDVPGHERFVRNMLAGASGIDGVLMVIAADESVMPQTREHLDICRLLGVTNGVIALTKADLVDSETVDLVRLETQELVAGTFLEEAPMVAVSARSGAGISELQDALSTLADTVVGRRDDGVPRIPIDRAFSLKGFGTVVTGTQVSGRIARDAELALLPSGRRVKVRGVHVHGEAQSTASAGQRVAINLAGIDVDELRRGDTLTVPGGMCDTTRVDGRVTLLESARDLKYGARVRFHQGATEVMARIALGAACDVAEGEAPFPPVLKSGRSAYARLHLERAVAVTRGDRFVLRSYSPPLTIAGGVVLDSRPSRGRLRSDAGRTRLERLDGTDRDALSVMVTESAGDGVAPDDLVPRLGLPVERVRVLADELVAAGEVCVAGGRVVPQDRVGDTATALVAAVKAYHHAHPLEPGMPREEARERLARGCGPALFQYVVDDLVEQGTLVAAEHVAMADHRVVLSDDEQRVKDRVVEQILGGGLAPLDTARWARDEGIAETLVDRMVGLAVREGTLERVDALVFHQTVLERLKQDVVALKAGQEGPVRLGVPQFKEHFGITRKYAIPLLEYLDHARITRRLGPDRVVI